MKFPITKKRFERFWLYDWVAVILTVILVFIGTAFLYEMTYPKLSDREEISIVVATYMSKTEKLESMCDDALDALRRSGYIEDVKNVSFSFIYINKNDNNTSMLRTAQIANKIVVEKADIFIMADIPTDEQATSVNAYSDGFQSWAKNYFQPIGELLTWGDANAPQITASLRQKFMSNDGLLAEFPLYEGTGENRYNVVKESAPWGIDLDKLNKGEIRKAFGNLFDSTVPNAYENASLDLLVGSRKGSPNQAQLIVLYDWLIEYFA